MSRFDELGQRALDARGAALADPAVRTTIALAPGDILLVDNATVLHSRTPFTDPAEGGGRALVRI